VIINLARRAHDHNWELDPITRSLLDIDFYKLLMLQFIWKHFPTTQTSFTLMNRSTQIRLGDVVSVDELREQLEATRQLRFHKSELIWHSLTGWKMTSACRILKCRPKMANWC
jgi:nicotinate phosphoribosyltransferase